MIGGWEGDPNPNLTPTPLSLRSGDGYARNNELTQKPPAVRYRPDQHRSPGTGTAPSVRGWWGDGWHQDPPVGFLVISAAPMGVLFSCRPPRRAGAVAVPAGHPRPGELPAAVPGVAGGTACPKHLEHGAATLPLLAAPGRAGPPLPPQQRC